MSDYWRRQLGTREFKRLLREWEKRVPDPDRTREGSALLDLNARAKFKAGIKESVDAYYDWARLQTEREKFKSVRHMVVWRLHAEGMTGQEIGLVLHLTKRRVNAVIETITGYLKRRVPPKAPETSRQGKIVWELRHIEKLSERKIAAALGVSQPRVHKILQRLEKKKQ